MDYKEKYLKYKKKYLQLKQIAGAKAPQQGPPKAPPEAPGMGMPKDQENIPHRHGIHPHDDNHVGQQGLEHHHHRHIHPAAPRLQAPPAKGTGAHIAMREGVLRARLASLGPSMPVVPRARTAPGLFAAAS